MNTDSSITSQIINLIRQEELPAGAHLRAQMLADELRVSRSPINGALAQLEEMGLLRRERNRGFFIAEDFEREAAAYEQNRENSSQDIHSKVYFQLAEDRLSGELSDEVSEAQLRARYEVTSSQLQVILGRISQEGWIEKKPGYGWEFSQMLTTPDSLLQSYRLRLALEPAALLEPNFKLERKVLERCRAAEQHLLDGGIENDTADQLHNRGVRFHESLIEASGNAFFIDTIRRVNRVRRLLSYRSMRDRKRYREHCFQHMEILDLLEHERNEEASLTLRDHLKTTLDNHAKITAILAQPN